METAGLPKTNTLIDLCYMNTSTTNPDAIASDQNFSQQELDNYIDAQAESVAPEFNPPVDPIAARLRLNNRFRINEAIADGEIYWQYKQNFKKLKDFKIWLEEQHFTWKNAAKYIKLYETFASFPLDQIAWVDLQTLFQLCQPRYKGLLQQLQSIAVWTDVRVRELMQQWCDKHKKERSQNEEPGTGWRQLPGGGRGYQLPMLHIDWLGVLIERARKIRNQTIVQLVRDMTVFFVEAGEAPGLTVKAIASASNPYAQVKI